MVNLEFYAVEPSTGIKTKIENTYDMGSLFKGTQKKIPIAIFNSGDETAIAPRVVISEYFQAGKDYSECVRWKKVSLNENVGYATSVQLPDILPNSWMQGKDLYIEDFTSYPNAAGTKPDQNWMLWAGNEYVWEIYSGYLQHNVDSQLSRALWGALPSAKNFEFSMKITVRNGVFAGVILRDIGDYDTGYIVLVQGQSQYFTDGMSAGEGVIQVWSGKFSLGVANWDLLYQSPSIGIRGTHDYFKVKLNDNRFDFWYGNEHSDEPLYSFIDEARTYNGSAKPVICSHPGSGSILIYFDDIRMEVPNVNGLVWIDNSVNLDTKVFGVQYSIFDVRYGGV